MNEYSFVENLDDVREGDFVYFVKTRGDPWREIIEEAESPVGRVSSLMITTKLKKIRIDNVRILNIMKKFTGPVLFDFKSSDNSSSNNRENIRAILRKNSN